MDVNVGLPGRRSRMLSKAVMSVQSVTDLPLQSISNVEALEKRYAYTMGLTNSVNGKQHEGGISFEKIRSDDSRFD